MADNRLQRTNWLFETLCTDNDFRAFHHRINTDYENFNEDEKYRATCLGVRSLGSMLDELVSYFEGQISKEEWISLQWNMKFAAKRPSIHVAYNWIKDSYPEDVQKVWESIPKVATPSDKTLTQVSTELDG